ncbi:MAG TPA: gamma-glutamyltransferase [Acidimicrobiales bacterium]
MTLPFAPFTNRAGLRGMAAAADALAAEAAMRILEQGGSGADAAVAAGTVMAVVGPHLCGLGGDVLAVVCEPGTRPQGLLATGRAGSGVDAGRLRAAGHTTMPLRGDFSSVPVPGAVDGWVALLERYGRLPVATVLAPAIELAEEGFAASIMLSLASHLIHAQPGAQELCPGGRPLEHLQRVRLPGIARTLRAIATEGRDGFYRGEFGRGLLDVGAGIYAEADFGTSLADWCEALTVRAWGHDLWTVPPPSQGYLGLAGAWVAERAGLGDDPDDGDWAHVVVEAARAVGFDRPAVLFDGADGNGLLDEERLAAAVARISRDMAAPSDVPGPTPSADATAPRFGDGDTTYLCAIDADGLGVSLIQSNALDFGSHLLEPNTGVFLHNRGVGFSLEEGHPAELAPGRRPPHTLSPAAVTRPDGTLSHLIGAMGGDAQPQILFQLFARILCAGQDPATAVAAPRLALDAPSAGPFRLWWGDDLAVQVEAHAPEAWVDTLRQRGHQVAPIRAFDPTTVGCAQVIAVTTQDDGSHSFLGAADPRSPEGGASGR